MVSTRVSMVDGEQFVDGGGDCAERTGRQGRRQMKEMIRVEEEQSDRDARE
jgi:3-deoxy-D-arabino-heptulosonate 7-phosphate (DAHP) synthase class II